MVNIEGVNKARQAASRASSARTASTDPVLSYLAEAIEQLAKAVAHKQT